MDFFDSVDIIFMLWGFCCCQLDSHFRASICKFVDAFLSFGMFVSQYYPRYLFHVDYGWPRYLRLLVSFVSDFMKYKLKYLYFLIFQILEFNLFFHYLNMLSISRLYSVDIWINCIPTINMNTKTLNSNSLIWNSVVLITSQLNQSIPVRWKNSIFLQSYLKRVSDHSFNIIYVPNFIITHKYGETAEEQWRRDYFCCWHLSFHCKVPLS